MPLLKPPRGILLNKTHPLARGLVGCWLMNEGTGGKLYDLSANGNHGTFVGDTHWAAGKYGSCLSFDGDGDYVEMSSSGADWTEDFSQLTVSAWVKNNEIELSHGYAYVCKGEHSGEASSWTLGKGTGESWYFGVKESPANQVAVDSPLNYQEDLLWHHIVGVWNGSNLYIYSDGVSVGTTEPSFTATLRDTAYNVAIGASASGSYGVDGYIDNVMIFNRALSPEEIKALYADPFQAFRYPCPVELFTYVEAVGDVTVFPDTLSLTAGLGTPEVQADCVVSPSALVLASALSPPSVGIPVTVTPTALALSTSLQSPTVEIPATVLPTALTLSSGLGTPDISGGVHLSPSVLTLSSALQSPTVETGTIVSPTALSLTSTVHGPTLSYGHEVSVSANTLTATLNEPVATTGVVVTPSALLLTASVQSVDVSYGCTFTTNALEIATSLKTPQVSAGCMVETTALAISATVQSPSIAYGCVVLPTVQQIQGTLNAPQEPSTHRR